MITRKNSGWYQGWEPLFPMKLSATGSSLEGSKLLTVAKYTDKVNRHVIFPQCADEPVCVYEVGNMDSSVGVYRGDYRNVCVINNTIYPTERRTTKSYTAYDYNTYDSKLHVVAGTSGTGSSAAPAYYQWDKSSSPKIEGMKGIGVALLVAARETDINRITGFVTKYKGTIYSENERVVDLLHSDLNTYWYVKASSFGISYGGVSYPVWMIGCDNLYYAARGSFAQLWGDYCRISYGFRLSQVSSSAVFLILKGLVGLCRPSTSNT